MTIIQPTHNCLATVESEKLGKVEHRLLVYEIIEGVHVVSDHFKRAISQGDIMVSIKANTDSCFMIAPSKFVYTENDTLGYGRQTASGLYLIGPAFALKDLKDGLDIVASDDTANLNEGHIMTAQSMPRGLAWFSFIAETEKPSIEYCDELFDKAEKVHRSTYNGAMSRNYTAPNVPLFEFFGDQGYIVATPGMNAHKSIIIDVMGSASFAATLEKLVRNYTDAKPY